MKIITQLLYPLYVIKEQVIIYIDNYINQAHFSTPMLIKVRVFQTFNQLTVSNKPAYHWQEGVEPPSPALPVVSPDNGHIGRNQGNQYR